MFKRRKDNFLIVFLCGYVSKRSDLMVDKTGRQYVKFTVAVNHTDEPTEFHKLIAYNPEARYIDRFVRVGNKVVVATKKNTAVFCRLFDQDVGDKTAEYIRGQIAECT